MVAASVLAAACADIVSFAASHPRSELAVLLLQNTAPPPSGVTFFVSNAHATTRTLIHPDAVNNPFLEMTFPQGCLSTVSGRVATPTDSIQVTIQPVSGTYGFDFNAPVTFVTGKTPTARFFFASYADFTASRAGSHYTSAAAYEQALGLWREEIVDRLSLVIGSGPSGSDVVTGLVQGPGTFYAAALK